MENPARRRTLAAAGVGLAVAVLISAGTALGLTIPTQPQQTVPVVPTQGSAEPTSPPPLPMPQVAVARGEVLGWHTAPRGEIATVLPEVGDAAHGKIALRIDADSIESAVTAASVSVGVLPATTYEFRAAVRSLGVTRAPTPIVLQVGSSIVSVPQLSESWIRIGSTYTTGPDETTLSLAATVQNSVIGFGLDDLSLTAEQDGENLIPNPSFEDVRASWGVVNDSLVLPSASSAIAVSLPAGEATWRLSTIAGDPVAKGKQTISSPLESIVALPMAQGFYQFDVTDSAGATANTSIAIVDAQGLRIPRDPRFGVALHIEAPPYYDSAPAVASLGLGSARNDVFWDPNEQTPGVYEFQPPYVEGFAKLRAFDIEILGIVDYANKNYDSGRTPSSPEAVAAYAAYAAEIARAFDVMALEVFNEFNHDRFNDGFCGSAPECYLPLLQAVDTAVSSVRSDVAIVAGATALYDGPWFDGLWDRGALPYADAVSFHPYEVYQTPESLAAIVSSANESMASRNGGSVKPIWITELGWTTKEGDVSLEEQAARLVRAEVTAVAAGAAKLFWYDLIDDTPDPADHEGNFGLFYHPRGGVSSLSPKPAAMAQALLISQLGGRPFSQYDRTADGVRSAVFGTLADEVRVAWALDGSGQLSVPSDEPLRIVGLDGSAVTIFPVHDHVTVGLSQSPVFITQMEHLEAVPGLQTSK